MNAKDKTTIAEAMQLLHGKTGPRYRAASYAKSRASIEKQEAESELQATFRPHWIKIRNIIRRECAKRGVRVIPDYSYIRGNECYVSKREESAVGVNHQDYTVSPYIHVELWTSFGIDLKWSGYAKTVDEFERKFTVLLATIDGYMVGVRSVKPRECSDCKLEERKKYKCQRCRQCNEGSLYIA